MREAKSPSYEGKLDPGFLEVARAYKELVRAKDALGKNPPQKLVEKIYAHAKDRLKTVATRFPAEVNVRMGEAFWLGSDGSESDGLLCWLCLMQYRRPLWKLIYGVMRGNVDSCEKWAKLCKQWKDYAEGRAVFPSRFKIDLEHYQIFLMGISRGLESLTQRELADFFDDCCPGCNDVHDPNAISKQRSRFKKDLVACEPANEEEKAIFKSLLSGQVAVSRAPDPIE